MKEKHFISAVFLFRAMCAGEPAGIRSVRAPED